MGRPCRVALFVDRQPDANDIFRARTMTIISNNHGLVFIHVPKCGGSSVEIEFQRHLRWGDFVIGSSPEGEILHTQAFRQLYGINKHSTAAEMKLALGDAFARMRVAVLVREPLKIVESYYRYSKTVHLWIASVVAAKNPGVSEDLAKQHAWDMVRAGKFDDGRQFGVLALLSGTIKAGVLSRSFEEFTGQVADERWSNYLAGYVKGDGGAMLATDILRLEEPAEIEAYFQALLGPGFRLGNDNVSARVPTPWNPRHRDRFHELMESDYKTFGYSFRR
jgi:hypothetical protein